MTEIKWIEGRTSKPFRSYDYPEGFSILPPRYAVLWDDWSHGELREKRKKLPKELRRKKWLPSRVRFDSDKGNGFVEINLEDGIPIRTVECLRRFEKTLNLIKKDFQ